jgi:pimeloyl-ACP methyl ester carboxylesterase
MNVAVAALAFSLIASAAGAATPAAGAEITLSAYAEPGTLVHLKSGRKVNIRCTGSGAPSVVLTAGAGEHSLTWRSLQAQLAKTTRVCAWDRAGFGFSDPSPEPQDALHTTDDLEAAIIGARIRPPYVLVGHSMGSYESLMFAFRHIERVAGIVLIDPSAPFQNRRLKSAAPATFAVLDGFQQAQIAALKSCVGRAAGMSVESMIAANCISPPDPSYPESLNRTLAERQSNVDAQKNSLSLLENVLADEDSQQLQHSWKKLGSLPLVVLTAGAPPPIPVQGEARAQMPALQAEWSKMHDEIAALSSRGVNRVIEGATHYIYLEHEAEVIAAVREVMANSKLVTQP